MSQNPEKEPDPAPQGRHRELTETGLPEAPPARPRHGPYAVTDIPEAAGPRDTEAVLVPGRVLQGRWEIIEQIGRGGAGRVYKARDVSAPASAETIRAVKVVDASATKSDSLWHEFVAAQASHKHLVRALDLGRDPSGISFIVMDLVEGESLAQLITRTRGQIDAAKVRAICLGILEGLKELHRRRMIHRDLKPSNVLLDASDDDCPKITDFGITHQIGNRDLSLQRAGTLSYMAPEVLDGSPATHASDIYSFGRLAFHVLLGRPLRDLERPSEILTILPREACRLLETCLKHEPSERPRDARELLQRLRSTWPEGARGGGGSETSAESAMDRDLRAGNYDRVVRNGDIERTRGNATWRVDWLSAKALHQKGNLEDAYTLFSNALHKAPDLHPPLVLDHVQLCEELGRIEEAAEWLGRVLQRDAEPEVVSRQLNLLAQCDRPEDVVSTAIRFSVAPSATIAGAGQVIGRVILGALDANDFKLVIACGEELDRLPTGSGPDADSHAPPLADVKAALGLAWLDRGELQRAADFLEEGARSVPLGARAQQALWSVWNLLGDSQRAADSLRRIPEEVESSFFNTHADTCVRGLLDLGDEARLTQIFMRIDKSCLDEGILAECAALFGERDQHEWSLWLLLHIGRRRNWLRIPESTDLTVAAHGSAAEPCVQREEIPGPIRESADSYMASLVTALGKLRLTTPTGRSAAAQFAQLALEGGFEGAAIRGARYDTESSFPELLRDAQFLVRVQDGLPQARRARLLRSATGVSSDTLEMTQRLLACIALDPQWVAARERLADHLDAADIRTMNQAAAVELIPLACQKSVHWSAPERATRALAQWLHGHPDMYEMPQLKSFRNEDAINLVENCLKHADDPARATLAAKLALAEDTVEGGGTWDQRNALLNLVAAVPNADRNISVLRLLIQRFAERDRLIELETLLESRAKDDAEPSRTAQVALAALRLRWGRIQSAMRLTARAPNSGAFRLAHFLIRAECLRRDDNAARAVEQFDAAERCRFDPAAVYAARLLDIDAHGVLYRGRAACLRAQGNHDAAARDYRRVPEALQDRQWALDLAQTLADSGNPEEALKFCKLHLKTDKRSMALIDFRFRLDSAAGITADRLADATALAVARIPALAKHGAIGPAPIAHDPQVSGERTLAWNDKEPASEQSRQATFAAWSSIGAILYQGALVRAPTGEELASERAALECITPPDIIEQVATTVASCRDYAKAAIESRKLARSGASFVKTGVLRARGLDASKHASILRGLSQFTFQRDERAKHAFWVAEQIRIGRFRHGSPAERQLLAELTLAAVDQTDEHSVQATLALAATESAAGRHREAARRLEQAIHKGLLSARDGRRAKLLLGLTGSGARGSLTDRLSYLLLSPHTFPRLCRWLTLNELVLLLALGCFSVWRFGTPFRVPTIAIAVLLALTCVVSVLAPIDETVELPEIGKALREEDPGTWIALVAAAGIVLILGLLALSAFLR